jgi:CHAT domain-containing protein
MLVALLSGWLLAITASAQPQTDTKVLGPEAVERQLPLGDEHIHQLALAKGEYVSLAVEQRGVDVIVQTRRPDGRTIADFQQELTRHGREEVELVADADGVYTVAVERAIGPLDPGSYVVRMTGRRAATDADRSMQEARTLRTCGSRLEAAAQLDEARSTFERALEIVERVRGAEDPLTGLLLFDLAGNALEARDDAKAESLYRRSMAVIEKKWGAANPYPAMARSRLALLQQHAGRRLQAEVLLREATETIEKALGTDHPWFVVCLTTQANMRNDAGDNEKAKEIDLRALAILERIGETSSARYAGVLNNLGEIYRQQQDYARAEELHTRALDLTVKREGPESYHVSIDYGNLAVIARERKDYPRALDFATRALSIRAKILGPDHADMAPLLNIIAIVYRAMGDNAKALEMHFRGLRIWEKAGGPYHRGTLTAVGNIARTYAAAGDLVNALAFQHRADAIIETQLALNLAIGSERQKLAFVNNMAERTDRTISLHLRDAPGNADAGALAALVVLQRKGRVLDAMTDTFAAVRQRVTDPADCALFDDLDELNATTTELARLALNPSADLRADERANAVKTLETRKERLEAALSEQSAELRARMQPVTVEAVQAAMPDEGVLVEFAVFRPFDPKAERNAEAYGAPHYAAYVVRKDGPPVGRDLGEVQAIDGLFKELRLSLRDPTRADVRERARAVDERVMRPLRASFGDATRVLISPDGALNLVPFEALVDEHGCYLIQHYAISYLTSGRDLLRMQVPRQSRSNPVIVADPIFGEPARGEQQPSVYFAPIGGTAGEARAIKALFPEMTLLTGRLASKATIQSLEAPRILHIASHGFFLQDEGSDDQTAPADNSGRRAITGTTTVANPLLRSGLALAGANLTRAGHADGILTALEASGLDLWGTKLVTLSACDTGVGEVRNGEGVYGLRRAFVLAGAEALVMTLWPVSDSVTREPMAAYYAGLRAGLGRGDALREAKLAMLKRSDRQHPFYWASFIQSGEWGNLDGKR